MTESIAFVLFCVLTGLLLGQVPLVWLFMRALRGGTVRPPCNWEPKAAVVLCLRGSDPFLGDCIRAALSQDYPNYELHIIVDSEDDPAYAVARDVVGDELGRRAHITPLTEHRDSCGLKCSSVVQAVSQLDDSFDVVALVDADTVPHPTWLADLIGPLEDETVGATTGNRWYMPEDAGWGSLIRYIWNSAAVVQMYCYRIPWGGTLALKTHVFRDSDLLDKWSHAFCEDTMLFRELGKLNLSVRFVPALMMVNREHCSVEGYARWVKRQLLTARLYHPGFAAVVGHGVLTFLVPLAIVVTAVVAAAQGDWTAFAWAVGGILAYEAGCGLLLLLLERAVRPTIKARGEATAWLTTWKLLKLLPSLPLTQLVYTRALLGALFVRVVDWRGVSYEIHGPSDIRMVEYRPYSAVDDTAENPTSL